MKMPLPGHLNYWRRGWDSNPRYLAVRLISSQVHSTTLPPLRVENGCFRKTAIVSELPGPAKLGLVSGLRIEHLHSAHIRPQRLGYSDTAIGLLVVLQNSDQRSTDSKTGAIQCM